MRTFLVGYDLNRPGQNYDDLWKRLKRSATWWHHLDSTWLLVENTTHVQLRDELRTLVDGTDELLVLDITGDVAAWAGFTERAGSWIKNNV